MGSSLYVLILLIEWVLLVTLAAPLFLVGKFRKTPTLGICIWLFALASSLIAVIWGVWISVFSIFNTYTQLRNEEDLVTILVASFAPWILLALAGILLTVANQRLAGFFEVAGPIGLLAGKFVRHFEGVEVMELSVPGYFALAKDGKIYLSPDVLGLEDSDLQAILTHEIAHIKLGHEQIKKLAYIAYRLFPKIAASRALVSEVNQLCEIAADKRAEKRFPKEKLDRLRKLFI
jgi:Zn-dependent protease with chaperone function